MSPAVPDRLPLRLVERAWLTPGVLHLTFEHAQGNALPFRAGQFIQVFFDDGDGREVRRSYSIANAPEGEASGTRWELAVALVPGGAASGRFQALAPGQVVSAAGPFGRFGLQPGDVPARHLLVATGTGVAPYRAMLPELERRIGQHDARVTLILGARTREDLPWHEEWLALARRLPGQDYIACLSRQAPPQDDPHLLAGHVQHALRRVSPGPHDLALLCGHPAMVDDCFALLREAGLAPALIRRERYVSSG